MREIFAEIIKILELFKMIIGVLAGMVSGMVLFHWQQKIRDKKEKKDMIISLYKEMERNLELCSDLLDTEYLHKPFETACLESIKLKGYIPRDERINWYSSEVDMLNYEIIKIITERMKIKRDPAVDDRIDGDEDLMFYMAANFLDTIKDALKKLEKDLVEQRILKRNETKHCNFERKESNRVALKM